MKNGEKFTERPEVQKAHRKTGGGPLEYLAM